MAIPIRLRPLTARPDMATFVDLSGDGFPPRQSQALPYGLFLQDEPAGEDEDDDFDGEDEDDEDDEEEEEEEEGGWRVLDF